MSIPDPSGNSGGWATNLYPISTPPAQKGRTAQLVLNDPPTPAVAEALVELAKKLDALSVNYSLSINL